MSFLRRSSRIREQQQEEKDEDDDDIPDLMSDHDTSSSSDEEEEEVEEVDSDNECTFNGRSTSKWYRAFRKRTGISFSLRKTDKVKTSDPLVDADTSSHEPPSTDTGFTESGGCYSLKHTCNGNSLGEGDALGSSESFNAFFPSDTEEPPTTSTSSAQGTQDSFNKSNTDTTTKATKRKQKKQKQQRRDVNIVIASNPCYVPIANGEQQQQDDWTLHETESQDVIPGIQQQGAILPNLVKKH